jgi:hypothetical protein
MRTARRRRAVGPMEKAYRWQPGWWIRRAPRRGRPGRRLALGRRRVVRRRGARQVGPNRPAWPAGTSRGRNRTRRTARVCGSHTQVLQPHGPQWAAALWPRLLLRLDVRGRSLRHRALPSRPLPSLPRLRRPLRRLPGAVNLSGADLRGANLSDADLSEADLSGGVFYTDETVWPEGFRPPPSTEVDQAGCL